MRCLILASLLWLGCIEPTERDCFTSDDCPGDALCRLGQCHVSLQVWGRDPRDMSEAVEFWDAGLRVDATPGDLASPPPACGAPPDLGELVINELLISPPEGDAGDANRDGVRDAYDDEFVELVNATDASITLEGVKIMSGGKVKHRFDAECLGPNAALVIFGGPRGAAPATLEGVKRRTAQTRFGFGNASGVVELRDARGRALMIFEYEEAPTRSYTLRPEITGRSFEPHPGDAPMSPGTCANGSALLLGCQYP